MTASSRSTPRRASSGFTLTELAVVFTIVALLLASAMYTLSAQTEGRNFADTQRRLEDAKELLIGFAIANGRLPCPASSTSSGDEATTGIAGQCSNPYAGFLPGKVIGFSPLDAQGYGLDVWGNRIRYAVSINGDILPAATPDYVFTTAPASPSTGIKYNFNPSTDSVLKPLDLLVCVSYASGSLTTGAPNAMPACGTGAGATNTNTVVAVIWSQGRNAATASFSGVTGQAGADEAMNNKTATNSNHGVFIAHPPTPFAETNPFDDQVIWIPIGLLYSRMTASGVLP